MATPKNSWPLGAYPDDVPAARCPDGTHHDFHRVEMRGPGDDIVKCKKCGGDLYDAPVQRLAVAIEEEIYREVMQTIYGDPK
jgi:hypothetical protein